MKRIKKNKMLLDETKKNFFLKKKLSPSEPYKFRLIF
jgi:hypothetical protein